MERAGEFLVLCDSARFGKRVWCDRAGRYAVNTEESCSEFFFHQMSKSGAQLYIRCKNARTEGVRCPVRGKIKMTGEIVRLRGSHNHPPEFDGHGHDVRTARGNWLRALQENPRVSLMNAVLNERRRLPVETASQIVPGRQLRTARRQTAAVRAPQVESPFQLDHDYANTANLPHLSDHTYTRPPVARD